MSVLGSTLGYNRQNEGKCLFNEGKFIITLHRLLLTRNIIDINNNLNRNKNNNNNNNNKNKKHLHTVPSLFLYPLLRAL